MLPTWKCFHYLYAIIGLSFIVIALKDRIKLDQIQNRVDYYDIDDQEARLVSQLLNETRVLVVGIKTSIKDIEAQIARELFHFKCSDCIKGIKRRVPPPPIHPQVNHG